MNRDEFDALPPGSVLAVGSACPACGVRGGVELTIILQARPAGTFSLAGQQMKFSALRAVRYDCKECGAAGLAEPKD
jgi:hypothetical protein